jgi:hypothetical protein
MAKTITVRIDETTYHKIKSAADSERRTISNFVEYATVAYIDNACFVTDEEMQSIIADPELLNNLKQSVAEIKEGQYQIVE